MGEQSSPCMHRSPCGIHVCHAYSHVEVTRNTNAELCLQEHPGTRET